MEGLSMYEWQLAIGFAFVVSYLGLLLWARLMYIARSNQRWTEAQHRAFRATLPSMAAQCPRPSAAQATVERLEAMWDRSAGGAVLRPNDHIADWVVLHEAKRQAAMLMLSDDQLWPRLGRTMGQLDELSAARRVEWQRRYEQLAGAKVRAPTELRSTLGELLAEVYNARDAKYAQLSSLYNKAFWLTATALLPLCVLVMLGYGVILVAGAVGGLISRLQRIVYAEGLPTAYGSSWVPLFCAPLLGALAAWGGLHLLTVLQSLGIIDLKSLIPTPEAVNALRPAAPVLGVAVLLGLSERILNQFGQQAEKVLAADPDTRRTAAAPPALLLPPLPNLPGPPPSEDPSAAVKSDHASNGQSA